MPWNATNTVRNAGNDAGITSLKVRGEFVYGTSWHFGAGGNLEGTFKASVGTGDVGMGHRLPRRRLLVASSTNGVVYTVGHAHYCGNMGGGLPQYPYVAVPAHAGVDRCRRRRDPQRGPRLHQLARPVEPGPSMINWLPEMSIGTFTGQYQAGWDVTGNDDYVVVGGEFPRVNGVNQQGLVRFARRTLLAPQQRQHGPRVLEQRDRADPRPDLTDFGAGELAGRLRP